MQKIKIGDKIKPIGIARYRGTRGGRDVVSIISNEARVVTMHYYPSLGYFYCNKSICCKEIGLPMVRIIVPVLTYTVKEYPRKYGAPVSLYYLSLSQSAYEKSIVEIDQIVEGITKIDLSISCEDEKYQSLIFNQLGEAFWKKDKELAQTVTELWTQYQNMIQMSVARTLDDSRILKALQQNPKGQTTPPNYSSPSVPAQIVPKQLQALPEPLSLDQGEEKGILDSMDVEDFSSLLDNP